MKNNKAPEGIDATYLDTQDKKRNIRLNIYASHKQKQTKNNNQI